MNEFFGLSFIGFFLGFISTPLAVYENADMEIERIRAAEEVCIQANSELVSLDRSIATCKNRAEIPYEVLK